MVSGRRGDMNFAADGVQRALHSKSGRHSIWESQPLPHPSQCSFGHRRLSEPGQDELRATLLPLQVPKAVRHTTSWSTTICGLLLSFPPSLSSASALTRVMRVCFTMCVKKPSRACIKCSSGRLARWKKDCYSRPKLLCFCSKIKKKTLELKYNPWTRIKFLSLLLALVATRTL